MLAICVSACQETDRSQFRSRISLRVTRQQLHSFVTESGDDIVGMTEGGWEGVKRRNWRGGAQLVTMLNNQLWRLLAPICLRNRIRWQIEYSMNNRISLSSAQPHLTVRITMLLGSGDKVSSVCEWSGGVDAVGMHSQCAELSRGDSKGIYQQRRWTICRQLEYQTAHWTNNKYPFRQFSMSWQLEGHNMLIT